MRTIVNTEQSQAWNGPEGRHWSDHQGRWNAVNEGVDQPLLDAAAIRPDDRILDIGCGTGQTTRLAARRAPHGTALGLDLSEPMLARARELAAHEGPAAVAFRQGDAQIHPFDPGGFSVAISRFGVMFFADPVAAFRNIATALRPEGRLAFVCMSEPRLSEWTALLDLLPDPEDTASPGGPGMFSLADPDEVRRVLAEAGYTDVALRPVEYAGHWGRDVPDAAEFLLTSGPAAHRLARLTPSAAARARDAVAAYLAPRTRPTGVHLRTAAWLVTARRA